MTTSRSAARVLVAHGAYALVAHLACLLAMPPWLVRVWRDRRQGAWIGQRLGNLPAGNPAGRPIWIHAVSVGEVKASRSLVQSLRENHPDLPLVLSTGTITGFETARQLFPDVYVFPLPLDLSWVVSRVVRRIDPRLIVLLELEVWPALMRAADQAGVPQVILNGRVSESSFRSYKRLKWWLPEFDRIDYVAAQDQTYADRITTLGVPPERVTVTGNLKHDLTAAADPRAVEQLGAALGLGGGTPVFVAGSTHEGEDGPVVRAWLTAGGPEVGRMVLVPRHLDRLKDIGRMLRRLEVSFVLRSEAGPQADPGQVLLVDTMGELEAFFALADVVFLGGSLVPVGGHNVLEPAAAGRPVLVGPYLETCQREAHILGQAGGLRIVADEAELAAQLELLLADRAQREVMGAAALRAVHSLAGATEANLGLLREKGWLTQGRPEPSESDTLDRSAAPTSAPHAARSTRTGASLP